MLYWSLKNEFNVDLFKRISQFKVLYWPLPSVTKFLPNVLGASSAGTQKDMILMRPGSPWLLNQLAPAGTWWMSLPVAWQPDLPLPAVISDNLIFFLSLLDGDLTQYNKSIIIAMFYHLSIVRTYYLHSSCRTLFLRFWVV